MATPPPRGSGHPHVGLAYPKTDPSGNGDGASSASVAGSVQDQRFKRPSSILTFLFTRGIALSEFLLLPVLAVYALAKLLEWIGLPEQMTMPLWFAAAPFLYLSWAIIYMALSALEIQLLFFNYEKPRYVSGHIGDPQEAKHARLVFCYARAYFMQSLPFMHIMAGMPILRQLHMLAYAPGWTYDTGLFTNGAGFFHDPDLVDVGNDVVAGGGCVISSHSMTTEGAGRFAYVSARTRIGDRVTLGGESRIWMGVSIGADAIIEAGSNVVPFTQIGPGEVWGGNPAVFLRTRSGLELASPDDAQANSARGDAKEVSHNVKMVNDVDFHGAAKHVVAQVFLDTGDSVERKSARHWDSLERMAIAATLIDAYGLRLKPEQIWELQTFADVERVIGECVNRGRGGAAADASVAAEVRPNISQFLPAANAPCVLGQGSTEGDQTHSPVSIVVAASFSVEPLASSLRLWTGTHGLRTPIETFGINQIFRALVNEGGCFQANPDGLNVVLLRCEDLPDDPATARKAIDDLLIAVRRFAEITSHNASLAVATLPPLLPVSMIAGRVAANDLRDYWRHALAQIARIEIIDFAGIVERIGLDAASDCVMERVTRAPYSRAVYRDLGIELARVLQRRRDRKVF